MLHVGIFSALLYFTIKDSILHCNVSNVMKFIHVVYSEIDETIQFIYQLLPGHHPDWPPLPAAAPGPPAPRHPPQPPAPAPPWDIKPWKCVHISKL